MFIVKDAENSSHDSLNIAKSNILWILRKESIFCRRARKRTSKARVDDFLLWTLLSVLFPKNLEASISIIRVDHASTAEARILFNVPIDDDIYLHNGEKLEQLRTSNRKKNKQVFWNKYESSEGHTGLLRLQIGLFRLDPHSVTLGRLFFFLFGR